MTSHSNIGKALRRVQADKRISNVDVARHFKVNPVQVARWRNSDDNRFSRVVEFAQFFDVPLQEFVELGR